jgi:hypothetical protein
MVNMRICEQYDVFPIAVRETKGRPTLLLAMADPLNVTAIDEIAFTTGCIVKPAIAQISSLDQALKKHYRGEAVAIAPLTFDRVTVKDPLSPQQSGSHKAPALNLVEEVSGPALAAKVENNYEGLPTGTFAMPPVSDEGPPVALGAELPKSSDLEAVEGLEKKFWALMRVLARRGLITKEEFLAELGAMQQ